MVDHSLQEIVIDALDVLQILQSCHVGLSTAKYSYTTVGQSEGEWERYIARTCPGWL